MIEQILSKPIMMMTGKEFLELLRLSALHQSPTISKDFTTKKYVYGLNGLASILKCGRTKAQEIKNSGIIDDAYFQSGRKIIFDSEKVLEILQKSK